MSAPGTPRESAQNGKHDTGWVDWEKGAAARVVAMPLVLRICGGQAFHDVSNTQRKFRFSDRSSCQNPHP